MKVIKTIDTRDTITITKEYVVGDKTYTKTISSSAVTTSTKIK